MITDMPTAMEFEQTGIAFLNLAWDSVMSLAFDIEWGQDDFTEEEIARYWEAAKHPLATALALTHQGIDFLLKGKIARVSPFLLISGSPREWPKHSHKKDTAFSDFHVLDSNDLIRAHDTVSPTRLSNEFVEMCEKLRLRRNSIFHTVDRRMGATVREVLVAILQAVHILMGAKKWVEIRPSYIEKTPASVAFSPDHVEELLVQETEKTVDLLTRSETERLLGFFKQRRRYVCPVCWEKCYWIRKCGDHMVRLAQLTPNTPQSTNLHCIVCGQNTTVVRRPCAEKDCRGNVIQPVAAGYSENTRTLGVPRFFVRNVPSKNR
jgi:hypothetical protein